MTKMYILVLDDAPAGHDINCAAHAAVECVIRYFNTTNIQRWYNLSFKKVTCKVSRRELDAARLANTDNVLIHESALGGKLVAAAFLPKESNHEIFRTFKLWK